jgi:hypothetical protein
MTISQLRSISRYGYLQTIPGRLPSVRFQVHSRRQNSESPANGSGLFIITNVSGFFPAKGRPETADA